MSIGRVHAQDGQTKAECSRCPWTTTETAPGKAAKALMEHSANEHGVAI